MAAFVLRRLSKLDIFGAKIGINVRGDQSLQSACGGLISVLLFAFFII